MTITEHPDPIALASFAEQPIAQHSVREHILHCATCRTKVDTMMSLQHQLGMLLPELVPTQQALVNEIDIAAFVDDSINPALRLELAEKIQDDAASLKYALHYATHSAAMRQALQSQPTHVTTSDPAGSVWHRLKHWLAGPAPAWGLATTATVLLGVSLVLNTPLPQQDANTLRIASYQDETKLYFQTETVPGIGFFHNAQPKQTIDFTGVTLKLRAPNTLIAHWPAVENAAYYTFNLHRIGAGNPQTLGEIRVTAPELEMIFEPQPGRRYEWQLTGQTREGLSFQTQGGFVVNKG